MENRKKPVRPFSLDYEEAKSKIAEAVNEATQIVPFCLLEDMISDLARQVQECARNERERARISYERELAEYEKGE